MKNSWKVDEIKKGAPEMVNNILVNTKYTIPPKKSI